MNYNTTSGQEQGGDKQAHESSRALLWPSPVLNARCAAGLLEGSSSLASRYGTVGYGRLDDGT
jgi:hypothetical protein